VPPESSYSPRLRTAVVLCGVGTAGVYQAGVLRALTEAGVKIDLLAAHGAGTMTALCGAIDGAARLWDPAGPWLSPRLRTAYRWRRALRVAAVGLGLTGALIVSPVAVLAFAAVIYVLSLAAGLISLPNISLWLVEVYQRAVAMLFSPPIIPTILPRVVVLSMLIVLGVLAGAAIQAFRHDRARRRWRGAFWWRLVGSPLQADEPETTLIQALWGLVRGASTEPQPAAAEIGRRYIEMLTENVGQPGFRELLIAVHDLDARRDLVASVLPAELRSVFNSRRAGGGSGVPGPREAESIDLSGSGRELVIDLLRGALRLPAATPPHVVEFAADSYWRGEAHRLCDRPELLVRLIDEISIVGAEQVVFVSPAGPAALPHGMRSTPLDLRARMGELVRSIETSALHDAWSLASTRFSGVFVIHPNHNPIGPFQFSGAYDESSDRQRALAELLAQGYQDAYRQFIEPIVAAGEKVEA
jgi:hypothetical protein